MALTPFSARLAMSASVTKVSRCSTTAARRAAAAPPVARNSVTGREVLSSASQACLEEPVTM